MAIDVEFASGRTDFDAMDMAVEMKVGVVVAHLAIDGRHVVEQDAPDARLEAQEARVVGRHQNDGQVVVVETNLARDVVDRNRLHILIRSHLCFSIFQNY